MLAVAQLGSAQPLIGSDWLLLSFAAPIIGGTALAGGYVSIIGAILAVLVIALIQNGLVLAKVDPVLGAVPARRADRRYDRPQSLARAPDTVGVVAQWISPSTTSARASRASGRSTMSRSTSAPARFTR